MATVSSHILDSVSGAHAAGIRCQLFRLDGDRRRPVFDVTADAEGRIAERVEVGDAGGGAEFELVIHGADYFAAQGRAMPSSVSTVVLRFVIDDDARRYHLPVMLAPHAYSACWSG